MFDVSCCEPKNVLPCDSSPAGVQVIKSLLLHINNRKNSFLNVKILDKSIRIRCCFWARKQVLQIKISSKSRPPKRLQL